MKTPLSYVALVMSFTAAHAATPYFEEHFDSNILNTNLEDADQEYVIESGLIHRTTWSGPASNRHYVRTLFTDYMSLDFVAELSCTLGTANAILFFGIGPGMPSGQATFNEPTPSIMLRMHDMAGGNFHGQIDGGIFLNGPSKVVGKEFYFIHAGGGLHRARITKAGSTITFDFDENFDGNFRADGTYTITNVFVLAPWLTSTNSRVFFGTDTPDDIVDDLVIQPPVGPPLQIQGAGHVVLVWWPTNAPGFTLESSASLGTYQNWGAFTGWSLVIGDQHVAVAEATGGSKFFRLRGP